MRIYDNDDSRVSMISIARCLMHGSRDLSDHADTCNKTIVRPVHPYTWICLSVLHLHLLQCLDVAHLRLVIEELLRLSAVHTNIRPAGRHMTHVSVTGCAGNASVTNSTLRMRPRACVPCILCAVLPCMRPSRAVCKRVVKWRPLEKRIQVRRHTQIQTFSYKMRSPHTKWRSSASSAGTPVQTNNPGGGRGGGWNVRICKKESGAGSHPISSLSCVHKASLRLSHPHTHIHTDLNPRPAQSHSH